MVDAQQNQHSWGAGFNTVSRYLSYECWKLIRTVAFLGCFLKSSFWAFRMNVFPGMWIYILIHIEWLVESDPLLTLKSPFILQIWSFPFFTILCLLSGLHRCIFFSLSLCDLSWWSFLVWVRLACCCLDYSSWPSISCFCFSNFCLSSSYLSISYLSYSFFSRSGPPDSCVSSSYPYSITLSFGYNSFTSRE